MAISSQLSSSFSTGKFLDFRNVYCDHKLYLLELKNRGIEALTYRAGISILPYIGLSCKTMIKIPVN